MIKIHPVESAYVPSIEQFQGDNVKALEGKPYRRGRICTVDLLLLTNSDQLVFMLIVFFFTKKLLQRGGQLY
jgi:hypothetical protein